VLTDQLDKIRYGGNEAPIKRISIRNLLPETEHYMTYEGSTTSPACYETVNHQIISVHIKFLYLFHHTGYMDCVEQANLYN
jgi:carbonic anhydrase